MEGCTLCPRQCKVDRAVNAGYCGVGKKVKVARAAKHMWEEPCISGTNGSGTVFFTGCTLGCVFCQNREISREGFGKELTERQLADVFSRLENQAVHNLNLVTPCHFTPQILEGLSIAKPSVPVVMNTGGYERRETLSLWAGAVDVYLPDLKYFSPELSAKYSAAADYFQVASQAILEMHRQQPTLIWEGDLLKKGLIIRHLVLPGCWRDSLELLDFLDQNLPKDSFLLSLMSQYTPMANAKAFPELGRRVTSYEYRKVTDRAYELGFHGFSQDRRSAKQEYTPPFDLEGV